MTDETHRYVLYLDARGHPVTKALPDMTADEMLMARAWLEAVVTYDADGEPQFDARYERLDQAIFAAVRR